MNPLLALLSAAGATAGGPFKQGGIRAAGQSQPAAYEQPGGAYGPGQGPAVPGGRGSDIGVGQNAYDVYPELRPGVGVRPPAALAPASPPQAGGIMGGRDALIRALDPNAR